MTVHVHYEANAQTHGILEAVSIHNAWAQVREMVRQALAPQMQKQPEELLPLSCWEELVRQLTGPPAPQRSHLRSPEQLQALVQRVGQQNSSHEMISEQQQPPSAQGRPSAQAAPEAHLRRARGSAGGAAHGKALAAGAESQKRPYGVGGGASQGKADKGVFSRARKRSRGPQRQDRQDAAFFMGLQGGLGEAASEASGTSDDSLADG